MNENLLSGRIDMFFNIFKIFMSKSARTRRNLDALISRSWVDGFKVGFEAGQRDIIFSEITPNDIRKACGLDHIDISHD